MCVCVCVCVCERHSLHRSPRNQYAAAPSPIETIHCLLSSPAFTWQVLYKYGTQK